MTQFEAQMKATMKAEAERLRAEAAPLLYEAERLEAGAGALNGGEVILAPNGAAAPPAKPAKRRGRPPGSRNKRRTAVRS